MPSAARLFAALIGLAASLSAAPLTRVAATSLRLPATAPSYSYTTESAFGGVTFNEPVQVVFAPGETNRAFVVERAGRVAVVPDLAHPTREVFLDISALLGDSAADHGLLTMAFHPQFAQNGYFYLWFSTFSNGVRANRLARFKVSATDPNRADLASQLPMITSQVGPGGHDGGTLLFGADGYLYLSIGDGFGSDEAVNSHQHIDGGFFGCVLRLDVDFRPGNLTPNPYYAVHPGTYLVPADNPFVGATSFNGAAVNPSAVRTEFWAVGLRNPFRMSFDAPTGALWCADVGLDTREEIDLITRGGNYGWDFREGSVGGPRSSAAPAGFTSIDPVWDYDHSLGLSITGGILYRGTKFAELQGCYLYSDFVTGRIWALRDTGARPALASQVRQIANENGICNFTVDPRNGDVLMANLYGNAIKRLAAVTGTGPTLPATLADTGAFSDLATLTPVAGVVPYAPNVSFWSDYAKKSRWFALTDTTSRYGFAANGNWSLPTGAVWVKHFDLELERGNPASARRIETRFIVKTSDGIYGLSYRWNDAQTNATLVDAEGTDAAFTIKDGTTTRTQTWHFPARAECTTCHTPVAGYALSFNTRQLNRAFPSGSEHQLQALAAAGYLDAATVPTPTSLPALVAADNIFKPIEDRARSYLDANCAQCHQPGGLGRGNWDARMSTPLASSGIIGGSLIEPRGDAANRVIAAGDAAHSMLLTRISSSGALRMPPLASNELDPSGISLIQLWVASLAAQPDVRLTNLSARAIAARGDDSLILGFFITAPTGTTKRVLVRGIGPTLTKFAVPGALADPVLSILNDKGQTLASNQRWGTASGAAGTPAAIRAAAVATGAFALDDASADSVVLTDLSQGLYSAQLSSASGGTGVGLVELYDANSAAGQDRRLINTSVRVKVGTGDNILIPGLVIGGTAPRKVLIRAAGPALTPFGVSGVLANPTMRLFSSSQELATNIGWGTAPNLAELRTAMQQASPGFTFAEGSADCAMLVTLAPGLYSIQVSGVNATTGVALVEVYEAP